MSKSKLRDKPEGLKKITFKSSYTGLIQNDILDKRDVLDILKISENALRTYIKMRYLPVSVIGNKSFFRYSDLLEMFKR